MYSTFANDEDEAVATRFMTALRNRDVDAAWELLHPDVQRPADAVLREILDVMAEADIGQSYLVGAHTSYTNEHRSATLVYEGPRRDGFFVVDLAFLDGVISNARVYGNAMTLAESNRLLAQPLSWSRLVVLLLGLTSFLFSIWAFRAILISDVPARRRWALACLVGAVALSVNWTTGEFGLQRLTIKLPVFLVERAGPDAPWFFTALVPFGALAAMERLKRHRRRERPLQSVEEQETETSPRGAL